MVEDFIMRQLPSQHLKFKHLDGWYITKKKHHTHFHKPLAASIPTHFRVCMDIVCLSKLYGWHIKNVKFAYLSVLGNKIEIKWPHTTAESGYWNQTNTGTLFLSSFPLNTQYKNHTNTKYTHILEFLCACWMYLWKKNSNNSTTFWWNEDILNVWIMCLGIIKLTDFSQ